MRRSLLVVMCASAIAHAQPAKRHIVSTPDPAALIAQLASTELALAEDAAKKLGARSDSRWHDALLDALALGLPAPIATIAIESLAHYPAPLDVATLRRYAAHRNATVRAGALAALARYPDPIARAAIARRLRDPDARVREAAADAAARGHVRDAIDPLLALFARGEEPAARALADLADAELARRIADQLGKAPEAVLAKCLGRVLARDEFGPDAARVEVVHALAKIADPAAGAALSEYVARTAKGPARPSRAEAERALAERR